MTRAGERDRSGSARAAGSVASEWTGFADRTNHHPRAVCSLNKSFNPSEHLPHPTRAFAQPRPRGLESGEEAARFLTHVRE